MRATTTVACTAPEVEAAWRMACSIYSIEVLGWGIVCVVYRVVVVAVVIMVRVRYVDIHKGVLDVYMYIFCVCF